MKKKISALLALALVLVLTLFGVPGAQEALEAAPVQEALQEILLEETGDDFLSSSQPETEAQAPPSSVLSETDVPDPDGSYSSKEDVALYIYVYGHLPGNFMTKKEARALGWEGGSLEKFAPGMCIGGDRFGNYEGLLPDDRQYTECDIDTLGQSSRGAKRIVFSQDGLIYYTDDHYESFELLYGEP